MTVPKIPLIRLDRSRPFSECRGDRTPDDPHYKVHFWQGARVGRDTVLLPYDAEDMLIHPDERTAPWEGLNSEGKKVMHQPLYTQPMRDYLARKIARMTAPTTAAADPIDSDATEQSGDDEGASNPADEVNFASWLRGEAQYDWNTLTAAGKVRYSIQWTSKKQMVEDLVLDHKVVAEADVAPQFAKMLPGRAAA